MSPSVPTSVVRQTAQGAVELLSKTYGANPSAPGFVAALLQRGEVIWHHCSGTADLSRGEPVTEQTNFRLASVTKQFTATAVLLLEKRRLLALDEPLSELLPGWPAYGRSITVRHLVQHTSGLIDYESVLPPDLSEPVSDGGVVELMKAQTGTCFPPGSRFRYSNSGYAVLAEMIRHLSGLSFARFLRQEIFEPLGMDGTLVLERDGPPVPRRALGYRVTGTSTEQADQNLTSSVQGDGGIYSSLHDYSRWVGALETGALLSRARVLETWEPGRTSAGEEIPYGLGWRLETAGQHRVAYHPGATTGFNHCVRHIPALGATVVLFSNRSGNAATAVAAQLEQLLVASPA